MENNQQEALDRISEVGVLAVEVMRLYRELNKSYNNLIVELANVVTLSATEEFDNVPSRLIVEILERHGTIIRGLSKRIEELAK